MIWDQPFESNGNVLGGSITYNFTLLFEAGTYVIGAGRNLLYEDLELSRIGNNWYVFTIPD